MHINRGDNTWKSTIFANFVSSCNLWP